MIRSWFLVSVMGLNANGIVYDSFVNNAANGIFRQLDGFGNF